MFAVKNLWIYLQHAFFCYRIIMYGPDNTLPSGFGSKR